MTATQDVNADADQPDNTLTAAGGEGVATRTGDTTGPPRAERVDVRRHLMALRRW